MPDLTTMLLADATVSKAWSEEARQAALEARQAGRKAFVASSAIDRGGKGSHKDVANLHRAAAAAHEKARQLAPSEDKQDHANAAAQHATIANTHDRWDKRDGR